MKTLRFNPISLFRFCALALVLVSLLLDVLAGHAAPASRVNHRQASLIPAAASLGRQFVYAVTSANLIAPGAALIDDLQLNNNPNAIFIITPNFNPGNFGGNYDDHPFAVTYNIAYQQWEIFHQDGAAFTVGTAFNVLIPNSGTNVFVHTATAFNMSGNNTVIDNPLTNGNPSAVILATPNFSPGGICGCTYNNHPIGVSYNTSLNKWVILNEDHAAVSSGAAFNVLVLAASGGSFVHQATGITITGNTTYLDNALFNNDPNALLFFTQNLDSAAIYNSHNTGVWYDSSVGKWTIFNQDIGSIPVGAVFNVLILPAVSGAFTHTATAANIDTEFTKIDNALTNSNPYAIAFAMPAWNGAGSMGNHNLDLNYKANQWVVSNEDLQPMQANNMFNVLVPNPNASVFAHRANAGNINASMTTLDYPLTNGNPDAILMVTPNVYHPSAVLNNHPLGTFYGSGKWNIFNEDLSPMPGGANFNVMVCTPGTNTYAFTYQATAGNTSGSVTTVNVAAATGNPNAIVLAMPSFHYGETEVYNGHTLGVRYVAPYWTIFNQDGLSITPGLIFNICIVDRPPSVVSINRSAANPTAAAHVSYTVSFSEPVTGVNATDFALVTNGISGAAITSVSGSGAVYTVNVNTGSDNGTIRLDVHDNDSIVNSHGLALGGAGTGNGNAAGQTYTINKMLVLNSVGVQDGWVLESSETSNIGRTLNATATTFNLGDDAAKRQYRGILSFATGAGLPDTAVINTVTLRLKKSAVVGGGNPVAIFQGFVVDIQNGVLGAATLQPADFQTPASHTYGPFSPGLVSNWYSLDLTGGKLDINKLAVSSGLTQIRLRFKLDDNNNAVANNLSLFSGNAASVADRPQLVIKYYVP